LGRDLGADAGAGVANTQGQAAFLSQHEVDAALEVAHGAVSETMGVRIGAALGQVVRVVAVAGWKSLVACEIESYP